jgi:hypothetical protein
MVRSQYSIAIGHSCTLHAFMKSETNSVASGRNKGTRKPKPADDQIWTRMHTTQLHSQPPCKRSKAHKGHEDHEMTKRSLLFPYSVSLTSPMVPTLLVPGFT